MNKELKEKLKRKPFIAKLYRRLYPSYGTCGCCGLPWAVTHQHDIHYRTNESMGFFAVCDYCFQHRPLSEIEAATRRLFYSWDPRHHYYDELHEMIEETRKDYAQTHNT